jgi:signal transduction histidine kinase
VKKIADIHRANITFTSHPQQGTTVHISFAFPGSPS